MAKQKERDAFPAREDPVQIVLSGPQVAAGSSLNSTAAVSSELQIQIQIY